MTRILSLSATSGEIPRENSTAISFPQASELKERCTDLQERILCALGPAAEKMLGANLDGDQLWVAARILNGLDCVFGRESPHNQCQLAVGCGLDGSAVDALHVFRSARAAPVHFHKKLGVFHVFSLQAQNNQHRHNNVEPTQESH